MKLYLYLCKWFALIPSTLLYIVGWKKNTIEYNIEQIKFSKTNSHKKNYPLFIQSTQNISLFRFKLLHNLCFDLISFIGFRLLIFQPTIQISPDNHTQQIINKLKQPNKPTILYSFHFSNFEWFANSLHQLGIPLVASVKPLKQSFSNRVIQKLRTHQDQPYSLDFKNNLKGIPQLFKDHQVIGWMMDQRPSKKSSVIHEFLGVQTFWNPVPKYLESKFSTQNFIAYICRTHFFTYEIKFKEIKDQYPISFQNIESEIFTHPEQFYGFTHKRYLQVVHKTQ